MEQLNSGCIIAGCIIAPLDRDGHIEVAVSGGGDFWDLTKKDVEDMLTMFKKEGK